MGEPIIALAASEPREVATFVEHLIAAADGGAIDSFWALWQAFPTGRRKLRGSSGWTESTPTRNRSSTACS
jgi:hypothetical protein